MKDLEYFSQPEILLQIGSRRLAKLFDGFRDDLKAANILLPSSESENGSYFDSLAPILGSAALPNRLRAALFTLETAVSPDNRDRLEDAIQRRIPCVSLTDCAVDRALELWFLVPDELFQFQDVAQASRLRVHRASSPGVPSGNGGDTPAEAAVPTPAPASGGGTPPE